MRMNSKHPIISHSVCYTSHRGLMGLSVSMKCCNIVVWKGTWVIIPVAIYKGQIKHAQSVYGSSEQIFRLSFTVLFSSCRILLKCVENYYSGFLVWINVFLKEIFKLTTMSIYITFSMVYYRSVHLNDVWITAKNIKYLFPVSINFETLNNWNLKIDHRPLRPLFHVPLTSLNCIEKYYQ
jgi:hypothetical protein